MNDLQDSARARETDNPPGDAPADAARRAALGKLATWTPPVVIALTLSRRASAESLPGPPEGPLDF